jgi:predicted DNA-binding protein
MAEINYTFEIDERLKERIKKIGDENHRTIAGQVRYILEKFVDEYYARSLNDGKA